MANVVAGCDKEIYKFDWKGAKKLSVFFSNIYSFEGLDEMKRLSDLSFFGCHLLNDIPFPNLRNSINLCNIHINIAELNNLTISDIPNLENLSVVFGELILNNLPSLISLNLGPKIKSLVIDKVTSDSISNVSCGATILLPRMKNLKSLFCSYTDIADNLINMNTYKLFPNYGFSFHNYKLRISSISSELRFLLRAKICDIWLSFFERKRDKYGFNRLCFLAL